MNKAQRVEFFRRLQAANPHPTTELEYGSTFQLLIAVILSAQATDKSVNTATLKMPDGNLQIVNVKDPANLDRVKVGDRIVITYSEAVSINVQ